MNYETLVAHFMYTLMNTPDPDGNDLSMEDRVKTVCAELADYLSAKHEAPKEVLAEIVQKLGS